MVFNTVLLSV